MFFCLRRKSRHINQRGLNLIRYFEGLRLIPYADVNGAYKVGYGCPAKDRSLPITKEEAEKLLLETLSSFEKGVSSLVKVPLTDNQYSALVCLAFNIGITHFETSTLLKYVNNGELAKAALEFPKWDYVSKMKNDVLLKRREAEEALFLGLDHKYKLFA